MIWIREVTTLMVGNNQPKEKEATRKNGGAKPQNLMLKLHLKYENQSVSDRDPFL